MNEEEVLVVADAPVTNKIKRGRIMMLVGAALLFVSATMLFIEFVLTLAAPSYVEADLSKPTEIIHLIFIPIAMVFLVLVGIGGISYVRGHGPLLRWASIGAIALGLYILIDLVLDIRTLAHGIGDPKVGNLNAWLRFLLGLIEMQLFGGIFVGGWSLAKDYLD